MKKSLLSVFAASALLFAASSCSQEEELISSDASKEKVSFQIEMDGNGPSSRSVGDGKSVTTIYYEVWDKDSNKLLEQYDSTEPVKYLGKGDNGKDLMGANLTFDLVKGVTYNILFWAQSDESAFDPTNLKEVTIKDNLLANQESYDAFTAAVKDYKVENTAKKTSVKLKRPFAQVNVGTSVTDWNKAKDLGVEINRSKIVVKKSLFTKYDVLTGLADENSKADNIVYNLEDVLSSDNTFDVNGTTYHYLGMNYVLAANEKSIHDMDIDLYVGDKLINTLNVTNMPIQRNHRTNVIGNLLTSNEAFEVVIDADFEGKEYGKIDGQDYIKVNTVNDFYAAFADEECDIIILDSDIALNASASRSAVDPTLTISNGKSLTIDLNGHTLSATSTQAGKSYNMFDVRGTLTVKNGTIDYKHVGDNMNFDYYAELFYVGFNGTLNLDGVTAINKGGSDMAYVIDMANATNITVNVENSTLTSTYIPIRVFNNNKTGVNNVTVKSSTLTGKYCLWVQYWLADGRDKETLDKTLNLDIYNGTNTFIVPKDKAPIIYGFNTLVYSNNEGVWKSVSEDGTEVTLGSFVENGVIPRGFAGAEYNNTITKVVVEEGVTTLYDRTFYRFYALETVELPSTLTTLGENGDQYSTGNVFQGCSSLKNIIIPESVTTIGIGAFYGCKALTSINVPLGVTRIEKDVFRETGLTSIEFHEGVTYFGDYAFRDCESLTEIIINAPKFTVGSSTFLNAAAPYPALSIYVANAEMQAYLQPIVGNGIKVVAPDVVYTNEQLKEALEGTGKMITVNAGEYTFPASSVQAGQTINCAEGTVFTGTSSLNINGATVAGATFKNEGGQAVSGTINGTFKNCIFVGKEALRWCYAEAGKPVVFENCEISTSLRGFHFDDIKGCDVVFRNCKINGFNAYGGEGTVTFESCTFGNDASSYNGLNIYSNTVLKNCTFTFVSGNTNFIDMEGTGKNLTIENCTVTLDGEAANISDFVGGSNLVNNTVTIDGVTL